MRKIKDITALVFVIIAILAGIVGSILMMIGAAKVYGWTVLFTGKKFLTSIFAITNLWSVTIYKIGFLMTVVDVVTCIILKVIVECRK